ncbi:MAG TPA: exodeoxyribonuclease VII large subunit [Thermoanaerobaculia bacterium]|nr:exodeoxyribonuclease VII large subunit [Thermoanaerobaculia bacterium]
MHTFSTHPVGTYRVSELTEEIKVFLGEAFPSVWVAGEIQRMRPSPKGHLYFELVEKGEHDDIVGRIEGVIFRTDRDRIARLLRRSGQDLVDGQEVRCRGGVDVFSAGGRLQLVVREIDPLASLGMLERRRREILAGLEASGLLDRNRGLELPALPLRIGLVTSAGSAAYHDFISSLEASGYGFEVVLAATPVQGQGAELRVAAALGALRSAGVACAVLVRGGGSKSDLQIFESRAVAEAIAGAPFPVLTGLGHEIDRSIADRVAHSSFKTPTMAAEFLVARLAAAEARVRDLERALARCARLPVARAQLHASHVAQRLLRSSERVHDYARELESVRSRALAAARLRVRAAQREARDVGTRLVRLAPRALEVRRPLPEALARRIAARAFDRIRRETARVGALERLAAELTPERTLQRGFSITRTAAGALVRDAAQVGSGERVTTELGRGRIESVVERAVASSTALDAQPRRGAPRGVMGGAGEASPGERS